MYIHTPPLAPPLAPPLPCPCPTHLCCSLLSLREPLLEEGVAAQCLFLDGMGYSVTQVPTNCPTHCPTHLLLHCFLLLSLVLRLQPSLFYRHTLILQPSFFLTPPPFLLFLPTFFLHLGFQVLLGGRDTAISAVLSTLTQPHPLTHPLLTLFSSSRLLRSSFSLNANWSTCGPPPRPKCSSLGLTGDTPTSPTDPKSTETSSPFLPPSPGLTW